MLKVKGKDWTYQLYHYNQVVILLTLFIAVNKD